MMTVVAPAHPSGIREARRWAFPFALVITALPHVVVFTPVFYWFGFLAAWLRRGDTSWDYTDDRVIIPISLVEDQGKPQEPPPPAEPKETPAPAEAKPPKREPIERRDAGVTDAATPDGNAIADAAPERKGTRDAGSALALLDARRDGAGPSVKDTMSLVGGLKRTVEGKPNVALVLWFSTIRDHPLGAQVGTILACNTQWRDFIGDLIDPLQDLDGVMLTGPRMADTSKVTAIAQHRLDDAKVNEVMSSLGAKAKKSGAGGPMTTNHPGMVAVRFHADRADRIAFTHPRKVIIITPPEGYDQLRDQPEPLSLPPGQGRAMSLTLVNPWRPLNRGLGMRLPETLTEMRLNVSADPDGSVNAEIEFDDQNAELAKAHAPELSGQGKSLGGGFFLTDLDFVAHENQLKAQTHVSRIGGAFLLGVARNALCSAGFDGGTGGR